MTVQEIYDGSDRDATKALYARLGLYGPIGEVALNLFRAQKSSARAKVYHGGKRTKGLYESYSSMAYKRKSWAMSNLCAILAQHAEALGIIYGWQRDQETPGYPFVLYVDLPLGQVSFHAPTRGLGPNYTGQWDRTPRGTSTKRIVQWCEELLDVPPVIENKADKVIMNETARIFDPRPRLRKQMQLREV